MREYYDDLIDRVSYLYNMYENYIWKHDDYKLNVLIQDNTINLLLYDSNDLIDEIIFSFSGRENALYRYLSLKMLVLMFGNVVIKRNENVIYNDTHKPYLSLIVNDDKVLNIINVFIDKQDAEIVYDGMDKIEKIKKEIPDKIFYPTKFMNNLDNRIGISKKILRKSDKK